MSITEETFKKAMSFFASGVTIVTYQADGVDSGITVSAFCSLSLNPPLILVSIQNKSQAVKSIQTSKNFTVNILNKNQVEISNSFARSDDSRNEYLKKTNLPRGRNGIYHIPESIACIDCELYADYEGGDHRIFLGKVIDAFLLEEQDSEHMEKMLPLIYYNKSYRTTKDL